MTIYFVFDTEADAQAAADKIWCNMLEVIANEHGGTIKRDPDLEVINWADLTDEEKIAQKIYGYNRGVRVYDKGQTVAWAAPTQRETDGKWVIEKHPTASNNAGVTATEEEFSTDWF